MTRSRKNLKNNRKRLIKNNLTKTITTTVIATGVCAPFSLTNVYAEEIKSVDKQIEAKKIDEKYPETGITGWGLEDENGKVIEGHGSEAKKVDKKYPETGITGWGLEDENGKVIEGHGSEAKKVDKKYPETGITGWGLEDENGKVVEGHGSEAKKTDKFSEQLKVNTEGEKDKIKTQNESNKEYIFEIFDLKKLQEIKDKLDKYKGKLNKELSIGLERQKSNIEIYIGLFKANNDCSNFKDLVKKPDVDENAYYRILNFINEEYDKFKEACDKYDREQTGKKSEQGKQPEDKKPDHSELEESEIAIEKPLKDIKDKALSDNARLHSEVDSLLDKYGSVLGLDKSGIAAEFGAIEEIIKNADSYQKILTVGSMSECVKKEYDVTVVSNFLEKELKKIEKVININTETEENKELLREVRDISKKVLELNKLKGFIRELNGKNDTLIAKDEFEEIYKNIREIKEKYNSIFDEGYVEKARLLYMKLKNGNLEKDQSSIGKERAEVMDKIRKSKNKEELVDILKKPIPGNIDEFDKQYMESILLRTTNDELESQKNKLLDLLSRERGNLRWEGIKEEDKQPEVKKPEQDKKPEMKQPEDKIVESNKKKDHTQEANDPVKLYKKQEIKDNLNPKTGDSGTLGFAALGFSGLLGLVLNKIKFRKK
ncbi:LPXTG cell wall anchor domain-containing protein [Clostridioides difficile]|nr:LPXTG cell wall anchor domain-containing protein [Clostridioides difficile]